MKPSRRKFLTVTGSAAIASVAGVGSASAASAPTDVPIPDNTSMMYPTMGTDADNPTATIYGNFKCPFTQEFVWGNLQDIIEEHVKEGNINIRFRQVAYEPDPNNPTHGQAGTFISPSDPTIGSGSLAVWEVEPESYWSYFFTMFSELVSGTVKSDDLGSRMKKAGVKDRDEILARVEEGRYSDLVKRSTEVARDLDVPNTPRFEMAEKITNPRHEVNDVLNWVETNITSAVSHLPQEDKKEETKSDTSSESSKGKSKSGGSGSSKGSSKTKITFDGSSAEAWAHYEFTVSGSFEKNRAMSASLDDGDSISGSTAKGGVGPWKDTFTYTGKITDLTLSQKIDVYRNGEIVDLDELNAEIESNKLEVDASSNSKKSQQNSERNHQLSAARACRR